MADVFGNGLDLVTLVFQFKSRFPEFDSVADGDVASAFGDANLFVDPNIWSKGDYGPGLLNLAAHFLTLKQMQLAASQLGGTGSTDLFMGSISFGERRVQFRERKGSKEASSMIGPGEELLAQTIYGQIFLMLRSRNISAIVVV